MPRAVSAASRPRVSVVLPEPERGAAMTRPLAKGVLAQAAGVPVEGAAVLRDGAEDDDGGGGDAVGDAGGGAEGRLGHVLVRQSSVADDGEAVVAVAPGGEEPAGDGGEVFDRHVHDDNRLGI